MSLLQRVALAMSLATLVGATAPLAGATASTTPIDGAVTTSLTATTVHLSWKACSKDLPQRAHCTKMPVPRDWAQPSTSGIYNIAVARIAARSGWSQGMFTFNPGGPGGGGLDSLAYVYDLLPGAIKDNFDIVAFDPRGVGASGPHLTTCSASTVTPPPTGPVDWADYTDSLFDTVAADNQACLSKNAKHASNIGTWQVIRDLDAIRSALGDTHITFWGMSYGTTVGRAYAQQFPSRVRALLLDGTITPTPSIGGYTREHIWDDVTGVKTMVGTFGKSLVRAYNQGMGYLDRHVLTPKKGKPITRWTLVQQLAGVAAYQSNWPEARQTLVHLRTALDSARSRRASAVQQLADYIAAHPAPAPLVRGSDATMDPAYNYINCSDMPDRPSAAILAKVAEQAALVGGTGYGLIALGEGTQCAGLPTLGHSLPNLTSPLRLPTPPVIVDSLGDNRTPWLGARATANVFTGSSMITYAGTQHVSYGRISACVSAPVTDYFLTQRMPARSIACPLVTL